MIELLRIFSNFGVDSGDWLVLVSFDSPSLSIVAGRDVDQLQLICKEAR